MSMAPPAAATAATPGPAAFAEPAAAPSNSPMGIARTMLGRGEVPDRATLQEFLKNGGQNLDPVTTAWCAAFVNATLGQAGVEGTGSLAARSFLDWGQPVEEPQPGDIAVFSRGDPNGWQGHVGFFEGYNPDGTIRVLGGNQDDAVSVAAYSPERLLGFRRPSERAGMEKVTTRGGDDMGLLLETAPSAGQSVAATPAATPGGSSGTGLLDAFTGLLGGGDDPGRDDVFGGLLGNGEANLPMLMVGLQILQNAGPSLEPQSMFAGVQEAAAGGMRMQQFQDQRRGQADRQAMLERLTAADPELAALARLDPEGVSRALVERGFATADGGEIREVGGRLVRVMQDGTVEEIYAAPDAGTPDTENARQIEALLARGLSRPDAENIAYGFSRLTQNPVTGDTSIVDLTTGEGRLVDFTPGGGLLGDTASAGDNAPETTLWELAPLTAGPESAAAAAASRTIGNIPGFEDVGSQTTAARQFVNAAQNDLVRALSINHRFPVAEIERIRREIDIAPALVDSPASLRSRMTAIDRYLRSRMESELAAAQDPTLTVQDRGAAARAARDISNFLGRLGVPEAPDASGSAEGAPEVSPASGASRPAPPPGFVRD